MKFYSAGELVLHIKENPGVYFAGRQSSTRRTLFVSSHICEALVARGVTFESNNSDIIIYDFKSKIMFSDPQGTIPDTYVIDTCDFGQELTK